MTDRDGIDAGRRRMLLRLGLTATAIYTAPALARLSTAKASPGSGASRSSVSISRPAPPEIVVTAPTPADINLIAAQGYGLLSRDRLELMNAEIARFSLPRAVTIGQARAQILDLVPAALFDLNHLYQPGEFTCGADGCAAPASSI
jgi:hypothetical protein